MWVWFGTHAKVIEEKWALDTAIVCKKRIEKRKTEKKSVNEKNRKLKREKFKSRYLVMTQQNEKGFSLSFFSFSFSSAKSAPRRKTKKKIKNEQNYSKVF